MSEWLDLMLEEIARKRREAREAGEEAARRERSASDESRDKQPSTSTSTAAAQSK